MTDLDMSLDDFIYAEPPDLEHCPRCNHQYRGSIDDRCPACEPIDESQDDEIKEHPILFSAPMVRAILEGRKTQTRRLINPQPPYPIRKLSDMPKPKWKHGEYLWVKETFWKPPPITGRMWREGADTWPKWIYTADGPSDDDWCAELGWKKTASIFMPREASRITLVIRRVDPQRLRDITVEDCKAEGVADVYEYKDIWGCLNKSPGSKWNDNPWVWVIEFARME